MISDALQYRAHNGDRDAFKAVFSEYGRDVYLSAFQALDGEAGARSVVKQTFFRLQSELVAAPGPLDIEARLTAIADDEIARIRRAARPDCMPERLWADCLAGVPARTPVEPASLQNEGMPSEPAPPQAVKEEATDQRLQRSADRLERSPVNAWQEEPPHRSAAGWILLVVLVVFLTIGLLWMVAGILMDLGLVPYMPWGYDWFNQYVYPLFGL